MKKTENQIKEYTLNEKNLLKKIIDQFLWYQIEESKNMINFFRKKLNFMKEKKN